MVKRSTLSTYEPEEDVVSPLIDRAAEGDNDALVQILNMHREYLSQIMKFYAVHRNDQDDVFQELYLRVFRNMPKNSGRTPREIRNWLNSILTNVIKSSQRRWHRKESYMINFSAFSKDESRHTRIDPPSKEPHVSAPIDQEELRVVINDVLSNLSDLHRRYIEAFHLEQHSYNELCEMFNAPMPRVKSTLMRARQKCRSLLMGHPYF